jgi:hypothetical protein
MRIAAVCAVIGLGSLLAVVPARAGTDPAASCKASKAKATGKKASSLMKAFGKNIKSPSPAKLAQSISKAESKFTKGFTKAESKGGCLTTADAGAIEAKVDALVADAVEDLGPTCGNGVAGGGEECDGADAPDCPGLCQVDCTCITILCGNGTVDGAEQCDGADAADCPGLCQPNCICPAPLCGNGILEAGETCEPPCSTGGPCGPGQLCTVDCKCDTAVPCNCGTPDPPTMVSYNIEQGPGFCGAVQDAGNNTLLDIECGQSYVGGGQLGAAPTATPIPLGTNFYNVECCYGTTLALTATTAAETGSNRTCSSQGCLLGAPVPTIVSPVPQSVCTVDILVTDAFGSVDCSTGAIQLEAPVSAPVFLTGDLLPKRCEVGSTNEGAACNDNSDCTGGDCLSDLTDVQPCPICNPTTLVCNAGPNDGLPCTPATPVLGPEYPTSHDCPAESLLELPPSLQPFSLSTGTRMKQAPDGQFCGFCRDVGAEGSLCFEGDEDATEASGCPDSAIFGCKPASDTDVSECGEAIPCNSDADCYTPYETCEQRNAGSSDEPAATNIILYGSPAGDVSDRAPHAATLVSVHCSPPTFVPIVDASTDFPGPGSVSHPGQVQVLPSPSGAFIDGVSSLLE